MLGNGGGRGWRRNAFDVIRAKTVVWRKSHPADLAFGGWRASATYSTRPAMKKFTLQILALTLCLASAPLLPATDYHAFLWSAETGMQDLGTLGGSSSFATAVNDDGAVVGFSDTTEGSTHAFLWTAGEGMQDLGVPGGTYDISFARSINKKGEISGSVSNSSGAEAAFYWTATTGFIILAQGTSDGGGINDFTALTGTQERGSVNQGYLWYPSRGRLRGLGLLPGGDASAAFDVNNLGNVVGSASTGSGDYHPIYWSPATGMLDLGVLATGDFGVANAINDNDEVVGESHQTSTGVGFYWSQSTGLVELVTLPRRTFTIVSGINDRGMIAGQCQGDVAPTRAVLWKNYSSNPRDLGALPGGSVSAALGLNNHGQVVGWADIP